MLIAQPPAFIPPAVPVAANAIVPFVLPAAAGIGAAVVAAPLGGTLLLAAGIGLVAAGVVGFAFDGWGLFNSRPNTTGEPALDPIIQGKFTGTLPPPGNTTPGTLVFNRSAGTLSEKTYLSSLGCINPTTKNVSSGSWTFTNVIRAEPLYEARMCGIGKLGIAYWQQGTPTTKREFIAYDVTHGVYNIGVAFSFSWSGTGAVPYQDPTGEPLPYPDGFFQPEVIPEPAPLPQLPPAPGPLPITTPEPLPETDPSRRLPPGPTVVPVEPGIPPAPRPRTPTPITPVPQQPENPQQIDISATPVPAPTPEPTTTPTNRRRIGQVEITSNPPAPNIRGLALEVGFLESKLDNLLNPPQVPNVPWIDLITQLANLLSILSTGDTWTLTEVCPPQGEEPQTFEWDVPGVPVVNLGVAARLDAIAEMIQVHKNLKQPVCKNVPMGQPVQVQFVQNEESWEPPP